MKRSFTQSLIFILIISLYSSDGQDIQLPFNLGQNNIGTEFYLTFHPAWETYNPSNAFVLYISSPFKTLVKVEIPGKDYSITRSTIPNDVIEVRLPPGVIPYSKTDQQKPWADTVFKQQAIHVTADDPIVVYGVCRYEYTSDSFLALPVFALGKRYIVASYDDPTTENFGAFQYLPSYTSIIGVYDDTEVKFTLGGNPTTVTAGGMKPGDKRTVKLNEGDIFLVASISKRGDLSGSIVESDKPVGVISGNFCTYIPSEFAACDYIIEMELPDYIWGKEFHVPRIESRKKNAILRIMPSKDNTTIYRDGNQLASIPKSGGIIGQGFIEVRRDEDSNSCNVYSGSEPISITAYNPGQQYDGVTSDPFQMVLTPVKQYQKELVFNTPGIRGGFGYPDNYVTIIHESDGKGMIPPDVKIGKNVNGEMQWSTLNESFGVIKKTIFKKDVNNKQYIAFSILLPGDGVYSISSKSDLAAYIYGFSNYDSYGSPASAAVTDLRFIDDKTPPAVNWAIGTDGVISGIVDDDPKNENNSSKLSMVSFIKALSTNLTFESSSFVPGESVKSDWKLRKIDPSKDSKAVIFCSDKRGNDTTLTIDFSSRLSFEDIEPQTICEFSEIRDTISISNKGNEDIKLEFSKASFLYGTMGYNLISPQNDIILKPKSNQDVIIEFSEPKTDSYAYNDTLLIPHNDILTVSNPLRFGLNTTIIKLSTGLDSLDFKRVYIGSSTKKPLEFRNEFKGIISIQDISPSVSTEPGAPPLEDIKIDNKGSDYILYPGEKLDISVLVTPSKIYNSHFKVIVDFDNQGIQCHKEIYCPVESSDGEIVHLKLPNDTISSQDINNISIPLQAWIDDPNYEAGPLSLFCSIEFDSRILSIDRITNSKINSDTTIDNTRIIKFECISFMLTSDKKTILTLKGDAKNDDIKFTDIKLSSVSFVPDVRVDTTIILDGSLYISPGTSVIDNRPFLNLDISPNPANSIINVSFELSEASKVGISLTDLLGRQSYDLYKQFTNQMINHLSFDISNIPSGLYILKINSSDKSEYFKIVKY